MRKLQKDSALSVRKKATDVKHWLLLFPWFRVSIKPVVSFLI